MKKVIFILTMLLVSIGMSAQTHTVTGVVTDVDHEPMVGVSITSNPQLSSSASFLRLNVLSSLN